MESTGNHRFTVRLPDHLHRAMMNAARAQNLTGAEYLRRMIARNLWQPLNRNDSLPGHNLPAEVIDRAKEVLWTPYVPGQDVRRASDEVGMRIPPGKIGAIKYIRAKTGWGLKESKQVVDAFPKHNPTTTTRTRGPK